jgi:uncharacterized membrane protein YeaQ/YmgE (transglycosylase-associated protein family)
MVRDMVIGPYGHRMIASMVIGLYGHMVIGLYGHRMITFMMTTLEMTESVTTHALMITSVITASVMNWSQFPP